MSVGARNRSRALKRWSRAVDAEVAVTAAPSASASESRILRTFIRAHDWAATPLGPREGWPQSLRTLVDVMLGSAQPMFVAWGPSAS